MPLDDKFEFAELNLVHTSPDATLALVRRAIRIGYDTIAINIDIGDLISTAADAQHEESGEPAPKKRKRKSGQSTKSIPEPFKVDVAKLDLAEFETKGKRFRQFSRLTATLTETGSVHTLMHHSVAKKYDIIAVRLASEQMLITIANKGNFVDIVTFDHSDRAPWLYKGKIVQMAVEKGISFELTYASALNDSSTRRQVFANGRQLLSATRGGRGVILTSGASTTIDMRAPFDAANLVVLFGARTDLGRKLVSNNAKRVLLRCDARKTICGAMLVQTIAKDNDVETLPTASNHHRVVPMSALSKLLSVAEFRAQIERIPRVIDVEREKEQEKALIDNKR